MTGVDRAGLIDQRDGRVAEPNVLARDLPGKVAFGQQMMRFIVVIKSRFLGFGVGFTHPLALRVDAIGEAPGGSHRPLQAPARIVGVGVFAVFGQLAVRVVNEGERLRRVFERLQTVTRRRHRERLRRRAEGLAGCPTRPPSRFMSRYIGAIASFPKIWHRIG